MTERSAMLSISTVTESRGAAAHRRYTLPADALTVAIIKWRRAHLSDIYIIPLCPKFLNKKSADSCEYAWYQFPGMGRFILLPTEIENYRL